MLNRPIAAQTGYDYFGNDDRVLRQDGSLDLFYEELIQLGPPGEPYSSSLLAISRPLCGRVQTACAVATHVKSQTARLQSHRPPAEASSPYLMTRVNAICSSKTHIGIGDVGKVLSQPSSHSFFLLQRSP